ncbi:MAG: sensor histidine kinase [Kofleriaceae bacterium]
MECDQGWRGLWHPTPLGKRRSQLLSHALVYLLTPLAIVLVFADHESPRQFARAYVAAFIIGGSITGCFDVMYRLGWPLLIRTQPGWPVRIACHLATLVVAVGAGMLVGGAIVDALFGWKPRDLGRLFIQGAVISTVVLTILITADELGARAREAAQREALHRVTALRAELAALQARTDPHFLFNSLNTVAALIPDDPALAETLLVRLAAVFRYALDAGRKGSVALAEELAAVTAYLEVEALRLGSRLSWRLDRDTSVDEVRVPPFVLQPLVENAIRHGAGARRGTTEIVVTVKRRDDELVLAVEDQGATGDHIASDAGTGAAGDRVAAEAGTGTALADLRARLELAYPNHARVAAGTAPPAGWRAEVVVPMERAV